MSGRAPLRVVLVGWRAEDTALLDREIRQAGFEPSLHLVRAAGDFQAALQLPPDGILAFYGTTDPNAPDNLELLRRELPDTPLLFITSADQTSQAIRTLTANAGRHRTASRESSKTRQTAGHVHQRRMPVAVGDVAGEQAPVRNASVGRCLEEELREGGGWLRTALQAAKAGAWEWDGETESLTWSPEVYDLLGIDPSEPPLAGRALMTRVEEADREALRRTLKSGEDFTAEFRIVHHDRGRRWLQVSGRSTRHGESVHLAGLLQDITERREAEETQRDNHSLLRAVIDGTSEAVFVKDKQGCYLLMNEAGAQLIGKKPADFIGRDDWEIFEPTVARRLIEDDQYVVENGRTRMVETITTGSGVRRAFLTTKSPRRSVSGEVVGVVGIAVDITQRKEAEQQIEASERRFRALVENSWDGVALLNERCELLYASPAVERIMGNSSCELLGRSALDWIHKQDLENSTRIFERILEVPATPFVSRHRMRHQDMSWRWLEFTATNLLDEPSLRSVVVNFRDITEAKQAEEDLQLRDRAIQAVAAGILITDPNQPDNPIVYASPGCERLTGYAPEEIVGRNCRFLQGKDTDSKAVERIRAAIRDGEQCDLELLNYRKDGSSFWNSLSISPVRNADGRLTHFIGVQTDVTERRRLEMHLRQAQKMEAVGRLAGGVAHDFNNLLTVINGYTDLLLERLERDDPMRVLLTEVHKAGERAGTLTRQLLVFSRQSVLEPKVLDINGVVADTERMLGRLIGEDVRLTTALEPNLPPVKADPVQLQQALINLVVNARDAMPQGGRLSIETRDVDLLPDQQCHCAPDCKPGRYSVLAVSDTGVGMDEATKARIFEPFFTTKEVGKGTGLGLAMVYGFVRSSGGHVGVCSEPGQGTTFQLYFPQVQERVSSDKSGHGATDVPAGNETLLLVEDDDAVRVLTRHALQNMGYTVLEASNGWDAVRQAEDHRGPIHLLVTDVVMPNMGGQQVAERIAGVHPETRVLFCSGYADDAVLRHGILAEEVAFFQKPFTVGALARKVREVLDQPSGRSAD
jgi:two-component system cell cycle sensor histidine kinase/response regulator CckA